MFHYRERGTMDVIFSLDFEEIIKPSGLCEADRVYQEKI